MEQQTTEMWVHPGIVATVTESRWEWTSLGMPEKEPHMLVTKPAGENLWS